EQGAKISVYDPEAIENVKEILGDKIQYAESPYGALVDADALLIMTEWSVFRSPDFSVVGSLLKNKVIFDGRNLFELEQMKEIGFEYHSIGRQIVK
ncbi:MAG: UDP-glucose 6-dehydrogenase, partial [Cytophagales bacterium]